MSSGVDIVTHAALTSDLGADVEALLAERPVAIIPTLTMMQGVVHAVGGKLFRGPSAGSAHRRGWTARMRNRPSRRLVPRRHGDPGRYRLPTQQSRRSHTRSRTDPQCTRNWSDWSKQA